MTASDNGTDRRQRLKAKREAALHRPVLARHLSDGFTGRWSRRQWAHASLFATLGVLIAAIVPGFGPSSNNTQPVHAQRSSLALALPPLPLARLKGHNGDSWQVVRVERGQTLGAVFENLDLPASTMHRLLDAALQDKSVLTAPEAGRRTRLRPARWRRAAHVPLRPR